MIVTREGQTVTNGTDEKQLVTLRHGERWMRFILEPGESRSCGDMPEGASLTTSTDLSPAIGKVTIVGGTRTGT